MAWQYPLPICALAPQGTGQQSIWQWQNFSFPLFQPLKNMNCYSPHRVTMRNLSICIILGEKTQQRKDIFFRYVRSFQCRKFEMQDWTCSNNFHNKALDQALYICIDAFFWQHLGCAIPIYRASAMFWGLSDVFLIFLPKCNCYKIVQESSVYTCMKRKHCAYFFIPLFFPTASNCKALKTLN